MASKFTHFYSRYKTVISNISYLTLVQVINLLLPIFSYPYLLRVLGAENWGQIIFFQTVTYYISLIVNFGFNTSGSRAIAHARDDISLRNRAASTVFYIKLCLFVLSVSIVFLFAFYVFEWENITLLTFSLWNAIFELVFPIWFFQGINKLKYISLGNTFFKLLITCSYFILIRNEDDLLLYPFINLLGLIPLTLIVVKVLKKENFRFVQVSQKNIITTLKDSYILALSNFSNTFKFNFNVFIIKALLGYREIAIFDVASKVVNIINLIFEQISQGVFPILVRKFDLKFFNKLVKISLLLSIMCVIIIGIFSPYITNFLLDTNSEVESSILRILIISTPFYLISALYGRNCLIIFGKDKEVLLSTVGSSLTYAIIALLFSYFYRDSILTILAFSVVISFAFESIIRYYFSKKVLNQFK